VFSLVFFAPASPFATVIWFGGTAGTLRRQIRSCPHKPGKPSEGDMGRYALLWLLGVPIPILLLIYLFGGLH
jgi:hypothetical protein